MALIAIIGGIPLFSDTPIYIYAIIIIYNHIYIYVYIEVLYTYIYVYIYILYIYTIHDIPMDCHPHWSLGHPSIPRWDQVWDVLKRSPKGAELLEESLVSRTSDLLGIIHGIFMGFSWDFIGILLGFYGGLMRFNGGLMGFNGILMGFNEILMGFNEILWWFDGI